MSSSFARFIIATVDWKAASAFFESSTATMYLTILLELFWEVQRFKQRQRDKCAAFLDRLWTAGL